MCKFSLSLLNILKLYTTKSSKLLNGIISFYCITDSESRIDNLQAKVSELRDEVTELAKIVEDLEQIVSTIIYMLCMDDPILSIHKIIMSAILFTGKKEHC